MAGPSWLADAFAAIMILVAVCSVGRVILSRLRRRVTELDVDAVHAAMGAAMARVLVPRLGVLPEGVWVAVFGVAAAWFGWHAIPVPDRGTSGIWRCRFPVPPLVECAARLYTPLAVRGPRPANRRGWRWPTWAPPPARPGLGRSQWSSPCSCSATSSGPPTG